MKETKPISLKKIWALQSIVTMWQIVSEIVFSAAVHSLQETQKVDQHFRLLSC